MVLFVGRIVEKKGLSYLIKAFETEELKNENCSLVIVGDGALKNELATHVDIKSLSNKIKFLGSIPHGKLDVIYASADAMCTPSVTAKDGDIEGFGLVNIEALSSGTPVITTSRGTESAIIDGYNGFLVPQNDEVQIAVKIKELMNNPDLCKRMSDNAVISAQQYSWENTGIKYHKLLEECMNNESK